MALFKYVDWIPDIRVTKKGNVKSAKNHFSSVVMPLPLLMNIERKKESPKNNELRKKEKKDNDNERKKK